MRLLLDTHTLLWFLDDNPKLSPKAKALIENIENQVFISMATWFEISIKLSIGKLTLPDSLAETIIKSTSNSLTTIEISHEHVIKYQQLPLFEEHRDPFDRLIIATAVTEGFDIVSADPKFQLYLSLINVRW